MRLVVLMVLAALAALPLSVSAQAGEESTTVEPSAEEPAPSSEPVPEEPAPLSESAPEEPVPPSEPAPEEPALELKLDDAGVEVTPSPPRTADGYTLEEMELRVKRAKIGLCVSVGGVAAGLVLTTVGGLVSYANTPLGLETEAPAAWAAMVAGVTIMAIGAVAAIASGAIYLVRKRKARKYHGTPRRVQWDLARSRLVF